jgi:hypothetical protein
VKYLLALVLILPSLAGCVSSDVSPKCQEALDMADTDPDLAWEMVKQYC